MLHQGTKRLESQRFILRPFQKDDAKAMFERWATDEEVTHFFNLETTSEYSSHTTDFRRLD